MSEKRDRKTFLETARCQLENCAIPTCVAITASVVISKLGLPIVITGGAMAGAYAYWRGFRLHLVKPEEDTHED